MGTDPAQPQAQACGLADSTDDNSFRFTPIKAIRALPRLWERKPATPFKGGLKPRKLWKRFQTSFSNMQTLQDTTAIIESDALQTAINTSQDSNYVRGTKRMRVGSEETQNHTEAPQAGRSFFETKWDSEAARKKRKLPDSLFDIFDEKKQNTPLFAGSQFDGPAENTSANEIGKHLENVNMDFATATSSRPLEMLQGPSRTPVYQDDAHAESSEPSGSESMAAVGEASSLAAEEQSADVVEDLQSEKNSRSGTDTHQGLRSALRSSLDGEDAELLNDFLSKAKAKRAAKATLMNAQEPHVDATEKSSSSEDSPEAECVTPRSRRALEDLDTNSPSPVKVQVSPSKKGETVHDDETREIVAKKDLQDDEQAPASPAYRRSSRVKAPPAEAPVAPNAISLRRAKGTEFVFLQRTETQELALATKRNTRNNRGKSVMPKYVLEAMSQQNEPSEATESDRPGRKDRKDNSYRQSRKNVSWNEERLAEFEDEVQSSESQEEEVGAISKNDVGGTSRARSGAKKTEKKAVSSSRSSRSQVQQETRDDCADAASGPTTSTSAAPRSRRVRRLGESTMTSSTPMKTGSGRISKPPVASTPAVAAVGPSTPTKGRRKLVPKSPSSSMLPTPATKSAEQSFASGIPTRSLTSEGPKRKSMLEASAGCTPMPKRVRART
ncbi:hypothetical protein N7481_005524 [Penicillium waksmanii]|uniref:uncharacterized protein n=1 Tax=Penicillium waksmanii TaxID=69791 RepID=UPI00254869BA|nr:uncharacterized protein N7481_005524 [Penicillium waksmanii]KAJ5983425.1 hypothetical protein N7481_005524 [Penicillium waksmanii]